MQKDNYFRNATLDHVVDGDTVWLMVDLGFDRIIKLTDFRLYGINAPELHGSDKALGQASKDKMIELLTGKDLVIASIKAKGDLYKAYRKGKYGRFLATIYVGDLNVNDYMVNNGFAVPYYGGKR